MGAVEPIRLSPTLPGDLNNDNLIIGVRKTIRPHGCFDTQWKALVCFSLSTMGSGEIILDKEKNFQTTLVQVNEKLKSRQEELNREIGKKEIEEEMFEKEFIGLQTQLDEINSFDSGKYKFSSSFIITLGNL